VTTLVSFESSNGSLPGATLVQGRDGNLYGTTQFGGAHTGCSSQFSGCGTVFKVTAGGTLTTLYSFCAQPNCTDGQQPSAGLILGTDGNFYGTTPSGGGGGTNCFLGCGTIFKISPGGKLTTLYTLCSKTNCTDGAQPNPLMQATDGNFYGTTAMYGGTVFKITTGGTLTTLYTFCSTGSCADGKYPTAPLVQGLDGNLYGTTSNGGNKSSYGTAFKITTAGALTTLIQFQFPKYPHAGLVQATDGYLYGTSYEGGYGNGCGGSPVQCGTVFKMNSTGTIRTTYSFCVQANCPDGSYPYAQVIQATDGNFYGATMGSAGGTLFQITNSLALTTLHTFNSNFQDPGGHTPIGGLVQATDGNFYGTTYYGGTANNCDVYNCGTVFRLSMGLGPFIKTVPNAGKIGTTVRILGTNLKGATSVSFNGTAATFTVVSGTQIKTTVPTGATTGTLTVITPSSTLNSNVAFQVLP
jgi:uncharacterized repeat protein (TIGR03803 family)